MASLNTEIYKSKKGIQTVIVVGSKDDQLAIKDALKSIQGYYYNSRLSRGMGTPLFSGWQFPLDKKYEVEKLINDYQESLKPKPKKVKKVKPNQKDFVELHLIGSFIITKAERKKFKREGYDFRKKSDQHEIRKIIRSRRTDIKL
jgi:hypothetical protein